MCVLKAKVSLLQAACSLGHFFLKKISATLYFWLKNLIHLQLIIDRLKTYKCPLMVFWLLYSSFLLLFLSCCLPLWFDGFPKQYAWNLFQPVCISCRLLLSDYPEAYIKHLVNITVCFKVITSLCIQKFYPFISSQHILWFWCHNSYLFILLSTISYCSYRDL